MSTKRIVWERPDYKIIVALLCIVLVFFADVVFFGKVLFAGDNASINVPSKVLMFDMIRRGQLPLWNPYMFSGTPFLADINLGLLYPLNILYLILSPLRALSYMIIIDVYLAGAFMYVYGRIMKLSRFAAVASSLIFMFSGSVMTFTLNTPILNSVVLIPLILIFLEMSIQKKSLAFVLGISIVLSLQIFAGHAQFFYYSSLLVAVYLLFRSNESLFTRIKLLATIFIPVNFLTAIQLIPFLELTTFSTRPVFNFAYASSSSPVISLLHMIFVNIFGVFKDGTSWGAMADTNGYVGIVPLILAMVALIKIKDRVITFYGGVALVTFLIALGKYSPLYYLAFYVLPFFSRFRSPPSILILYSVALSMLAGYGFDYIFSGNTVNKRLLRQAVLICSPIFILTLLSRIFFYKKFVSLVYLINSIKKASFLTRFLHYSEFQIHSIFNMWTENVAIIMLFVLLFTFLLYAIKQCRSQLFRVLLILLIAVDILFYARNNLLTTFENIYKSPSTLISRLKQDPESRIHTMTDEGKKPIFEDKSFFERETEKAAYLLSPNMSSIYKIQSIDGYGSIVNKNYAAYVRSGSVDPTHIDVIAPGAFELDTLAVKYVITGGRYEKELSSDPTFKKLLQIQNKLLGKTFSVYENKNVKPRSYLLNDADIATGSSTITSSTENSVEISTTASSAAKLILSDVYYPGWSVTIDKKPGTIYQSGIFRSVDLSEGKHVVSFTYFPKKFIIGAVISIINWIYLIGFFIFLQVKQHQKVD
ncbi:hypothetical protein COY90_01930 [Candidatus Roizmanbacteria bacterium CG_4_10_14_0_8_um_filter_39_9]|uniref:YfhO family protein n=1 Tax=Candidatus Roizmanbacteria bacterium CG_4_10_14_0_8_um_filter_39_9 TaxID=1974829 RepID=A0A2M7QDA6_9BACT|nr:MAG: hypothetical protein COY90_01930 [Candidatus Roizmanbacteria bacterium CG_4_10_14_0_8_um_filter_39_9]